MNKVEESFFALLRGGLWEKEVQLLPYGQIDYSEMYRLAEEQSVVGLLAAGMNHVNDIGIPQLDLLKFIGVTLQKEEKNKAMNHFIAVLVEKMRDAGIDTILVKGQGVAQCYERPLWRVCGDVDFFLSDENYEKAKAFLTPMASKVGGEYVREKHLGMTIESWVVELHGRLYCGLSSRIERELDAVWKDTFSSGDVRSWDNNGVQVSLLGIENDAFYIFTHILQHFYKGGIGLRQICDWSRLLWTYRESLNRGLLESRLRKAGLMTEWKAFGAFAVEYLGMPSSAVPFYSEAKCWKRKAMRIQDFILMAGNFGHNRDSSYFKKYPYFIRKCISMGRRVGDLFRHSRLFPLDSIRFFPKMMCDGLQSAARGE